MKIKKIILITLVVSGSFFLYESLIAFSDGVTGRTKKSGGAAGCICHGSSATQSVSAIISGPVTVVSGDTATYTLKLFGGPLTAGGVDIAAELGTLQTSYLESKLQLLSGELTHTEPKLSVAGDTIKWRFKYKAPNVISQFDTIYANGNSVNNTGGSTGDAWNYAANFKVYITAGPQGVTQTSGVVTGYKLAQNYPNPFNPSTKINFSVLKSGFVKLSVYDNLGRLAAILVNKNLSSGSYAVTMDAAAYGLTSGLYYYKLESNSFNETKKMVLSK